MHDMPLGSAMTKIPSPGPALDDAQSRGWGAWLVLDPGCHPQAIQQLYSTDPDSEKNLLFLDSPLEHMHELSPRFAAVRSGTAMLTWLESHDPPGWGMILASDAPAGEVLAHLRSLLLVKAGGEDVIFRIWDGRILSRICEAMPEEVPLLLGPVRRVLTRTEEESWVLIDRQDPPHAPFGTSTARQCPWYLFSSRHDEIFRDGRARTVARNIVFTLYGDEPETGPAALPDGESLLAFAVRHVDRGLALGLNGERSLELFVRCCLLHGESFPDVDTMPGLRPFAARTMDEDAAVAAMLTICTQGDAHG
ncbi:MAG TPA: hypothetical protein DGF30_11845 [Desulfomicrobium sp.]|nr:hypothetical protein [Desulfomicrobium sp.]